jgi:hypothetical protein
MRRFLAAPIAALLPLASLHVHYPKGDHYTVAGIDLIEQQGWILFGWWLLFVVVALLVTWGLAE